MSTDTAMYWCPYTLPHMVTCVLQPVSVSLRLCTVMMFLSEDLSLK